jgi:dTDP-D-glucose 4,6-dehydratase
MPNMETWEWLLLGGAGFIALNSLVGLMRRRRDVVVDELSWQAEMERRKQSLAKIKEERRRLMEKFNRQAS